MYTEAFEKRLHIHFLPAGQWPRAPLYKHLSWVFQSKRRIFIWGRLLLVLPHGVSSVSLSSEALLHDHFFSFFFFLNSRAFFPLALLLCLAQRSHGSLLCYSYTVVWSSAYSIHGWRARLARHNLPIFCNAILSSVYVKWAGIACYGCNIDCTSWAINNYI